MALDGSYNPRNTHGLCWWTQDCLHSKLWGCPAHASITPLRRITPTLPCLSPPFPSLSPSLSPSPPPAPTMIHAASCPPPTGSTWQTMHLHAVSLTRPQSAELATALQAATEARGTRHLACVKGTKTVHGCDAGGLAWAPTPSPPSSGYQILGRAAAPC